MNKCFVKQYDENKEVYMYTVLILSWPKVFPDYAIKKTDLDKLDRGETGVKETLLVRAWYHDAAAKGTL